MNGKDSNGIPKYRGAFPWFRLRDLAVGFPRRAGRLIRHLRRGEPGSVAWWIDAVILGLDALGLAIIYELLTWVTKWNLRTLRPAEVSILQQVFGSSVDYTRIRIDERAYLGPRQYPICYVSFYSINSWGPMALPTLVHEVVHIWQYERVGAAYIPRALRAQRTAAGYDYGGLVALVRANTLWDFNYEQQADIVADYWSLCNGVPPRWLRPGEIAPQSLPVFERLLRGAGLLAPPLPDH
jgi:hypothetical protein